MLAQPLLLPISAPAAVDWTAPGVVQELFSFGLPSDVAELFSAARRPANEACQFELAPRKSSHAGLEGKPKELAMAMDLVAYYAEFPENDPNVRARKGSKTGKQRLLREGEKPESVGSQELTEAERGRMDQDLFILRAFGVEFGPPETFGQCEPGPCGRASCRYNLLVDVKRMKNGNPPTVKINHPDKDPQELEETCSLRAAARGGMEIEEVGKCMNLTVERIRQIEDAAIARLKRNGGYEILRAFFQP